MYLKINLYSLKMSYAFLFLIFGLVPIINGESRMVQVGHRTRMRWCKYPVPDPCRGIQFIGTSGDKLYDCASPDIITTRSDSNSKTIELSLTNVSTHDAGNYSCVGTTSSHQQDTLVV